MNTTFLIQLSELYNFGFGSRKILPLYRSLKCALCLDQRQKETLHIEYAMFCIISQPGTKYILRAFKVDESFWTQKQSCITQKVGQKKVVFVF